MARRPGPAKRLGALDFPANQGRHAAISAAAQDLSNLGLLILHLPSPARKGGKPNVARPDHAATSHLTTMGQGGSASARSPGRINLGRPPQRNACGRQYTAVTRHTTPRHASLALLTQGRGRTVWGAHGWGEASAEIQRRAAACGAGLPDPRVPSGLDPRWQ